MKNLTAPLVVALLVMGMATAAQATPNLSLTLNGANGFSILGAGTGAVKADALFSGNPTQSSRITGFPVARARATASSSLLMADATAVASGTTGFTSAGSPRTITPVPEPGTMMLLGAGSLGLAIYCKRRKNA